MGRCIVMFCNELTQTIGKLQNKSSYLFQQELMSWHTSKLVQEKVVKLKVNVLEWPSKSPDLNSVKMLCSILRKKLAVKAIYSIMELRQRLEKK